MRKIIAFCLLFFVAHAALAEGAPPEITPYIKTTAPYGNATVSYTLFTVYDATLWTDSQPLSFDKPFALRLTYRHAFPVSGLVKKTLNEMARIDDVPEVRLKEYGAQLAKLWPSVHAGDVITAINIPGKKTLFYYNGKMTGSIDDPAFNKPFFDVWLSPKTSEPEARERLLGGSAH